ncbi:MAG: hypothetical protein K8I27_08055 [Planctomycetes bacterium]|nr:hypothetical protein [Planctomycetota bacterium]
MATALSIAMLKLKAGPTQFRGLAVCTTTIDDGLDNQLNRAKEERASRCAVGDCVQLAEDHLNAEGEIPPTCATPLIGSVALPVFLSKPPRRHSRQ